MSQTLNAMSKKKRNPNPSSKWIIDKSINLESIQNTPHRYKNFAHNC